ncbi:CBF-domain-containing protein [Serendipita vermifera]|nr:CBF-domain-containing protein [Serendipita vermifera]
MKTPQSQQGSKGHRGSQSDKRNVKHKKGDKKYPKPQPDKAQGTTQSSNDLFKEAIFALGGDEEDYELLQNVSEIDEQKSKKESDDKALRKEISKMVKELGISKQSKGEPWIARDEEDEMEESSQSTSEDASNSGDEVPNEKYVEPVQLSKKTSGQGKLLFPPSPQWYNTLGSLPNAVTSQPSESTIETLSAHAAQLLSNDAATYVASSSTGLTSTSSDAAFLSRVLSSGTMSDRLSALTLMAQASPVHNQRALENLRGIAMKKGGKGEAVKAVRALVDWWVGGGAPERKLRYFRDQPLLHEQRSDAHLLVWFFEDWLKKFFFSIIQILEVLSLDPLPYIRTQAMSFITQLLISKPEQEQNLLRLLVNKLGDSERSIASKASYHLHTLLQAHPQMKGVVVREVSALVLKPSTGQPGGTASTSKQTKGGQGLKTRESGINTHARYYAIVTFNQIVLSAKTSSDKDVASKLVEVYFELFRDIVGERRHEDDVDEDPNHETKTDGKGREERRKLKERERIKLKGKEKQSNKTMNALRDDNASNTESKVISAILTGVNRALPFAGMDDAIFEKHMDTLFRITHNATFNVTIQALVLIQKVSESKPSILPRYFRTLYASLLDPRLATSSKQAMYLNLLFKSLKLDKDLVRVKAFIKRFLQALLTGPGFEPSFICGGLFLLGELFTTTPKLRRSLTSPPSSDAELYNAQKREPEYSGAGEACIWELIPLMNHYHPSVSLHAKQLIENRPLTANADLSLNTLSHFLDLFVYKNPKKPKPRGESIMQPSAALGNDGNATVRLIKGIVNESVGPSGTVNNEQFWMKKVQDIPASQLFFHKFFNQKNEREQSKKEKIAKRKATKPGEDDEDMGGSDVQSSLDSDNSDAEEKEIWKAIKKSIPKNDTLDVDSDETDGLSEPDEAQLEEEDASSGEGVPIDDNEDEDSHSGLDDQFDLADEDEDDIIGSDADAPDGLLHFSSDEADEEEWRGVTSTVLGKRKAIDRKQDKQSHSKKKRKLKDLPLFASAEHYQKLIDAEPEDNI